MTDYPAAALSMYQGRLHGLSIQGVVPPQEMAAAVRRLDDLGLPRHGTIPGVDAAFSYGLMIAPTGDHPRGPDPELYLAAAGPAAAALQGLLAPPGLVPLLSRVLGLLSGLPAAVARAADGRTYLPASVRVFGDGWGAPLHCDTYMDSPTHAHLHQVTDRSTQLSWYLPMSLPEQGGELRIYDARHGEPGLVGDDMAALAARPHVTVPLSTGDMVLFDAGRWFHQIMPARGPTPRRTLGGFAALSADHRGLLFWS